MFVFAKPVPHPTPTPAPAPAGTGDHLATFDQVWHFVSGNQWVLLFLLLCVLVFVLGIFWKARLMVSSILGILLTFVFSWVYLSFMSVDTGGVAKTIGGLLGAVLFIVIFGIPLLDEMFMPHDPFDRSGPSWGWGNGPWRR